MFKIFENKLNKCIIISIVKILSNELKKWYCCLFVYYRAVRKMLTAKVQKHRQKKKKDQSKPKQEHNTSFDQDYTPPTRSCTKRSIEEENSGEPANKSAREQR